MSDKEATARIKINKLLEAAGWRFFPQGSAPANIRLEPSVTIKSSELEALGDNFEKTSKGFLKDVLLSKRMREIIFSRQSGTTVYGIKASVLKGIRIPVPPLATQQAIVAEIEAEQALVAANRELIARFEKKIQTTLARIWGGET